jgi:ubiquinone biosynthesis protein COQ9
MITDKSVRLFSPSAQGSSGESVPPKGWRTLSIREDLRRRLEELGQKLGYESLNDVIAFLLDSYDYRVELSNKLLDVTTTLTRIESIFLDSLTLLNKIMDALVEMREKVRG